MKNASLRVADYMSRDLVTVTQDTEIMRAVFMLVEKDISGVPVLDEHGALVGLLTERDCLDVALSAGYFDEPGGRVSEFMSAPVDTVTSQDTLMDIAVRFRDTSYRRFPVVDDGRLVGIVSRRDVLRALRQGAWFEKV
jgi:CBS domain-containing protein